jgi:hypothetical protein
MADHTPEVTLSTLHDDLTIGFAGVKAETRAGFDDLNGEMHGGFADLKTTLVTGFRALPTRESSEEMIRLLRKGNRLQEAQIRGLSGHVKSLTTRIDALIRGRGNGAPPA